MKYFITGSNGFIGQHVVKYLEARGHDVFTVRRPVRSLAYSNFTDDEFSFVHLSAYGNHSQQIEAPWIVEANVTDLNYLLSYLASSDKLIKFYNVSTSAIQLKKKTIYSASKLLGELIIEGLNDPRFVNVRPYSVYGPGEADHRFIPTVIRALHSRETIQLDPFACHDWIHVEDFVDAMFNGYTMVGSGFKYQNIEIVQKLEEIAGKKLKYQVAFKGMRIFDTDDWYCEKGVPARFIDDGLRQTFEYYHDRSKAYQTD